MPSKKSNHKQARSIFKNTHRDANGRITSSLSIKAAFLLALAPASWLHFNVAYSQALQRCHYGSEYLGPKRLTGINLRDVQASKIELSVHASPELSSTLDAALESQLRSQLESSGKSLKTSATLYSTKHGVWSVTQPNAPASAQHVSSEALAQLAIAAVIGQLIEEKQLLPHDAIDRWFPDAPNAALVTIDHLLTHTSGLKQPLTPTRTPARKSALIEEGYEFCPGTNLLISSANYTTLGQIIERLEQETLANVIKRRIAQPLALTTIELNRSADTGAQELIASPQQAAILLSAFLRSELISDSMVNDALRYIYPKAMPLTNPLSELNSSFDSSPKTIEQPSPQESSTLDNLTGVGRGITVGFSIAGFSKTGFAPQEHHNQHHQQQQHRLARHRWIGLDDKPVNGGSAKTDDLEYTLTLFDLDRKLYLSVAVNGDHTQVIAETLLEAFDSYTPLETK